MKLFELDLNTGEVVEIDSVRKEVAVRLFSGVGLFETTKILNGVPLFIEEHVERIMNSIKKIWGKCPDRSKIEESAFYVSKNKSFGMLRIFAVEGKGKFFVFFLVDDFPYKTTENLSIKILDYERNPEGFASGLKPISYFENVVLREKLENQGFHEGIFLSNGFVAEGTRSNIFWVKDGVFYTPSPGLGILKGITRGKVVEICRRNKLKVKEVKEKPEKLFYADEVFLTSSLLGVAPVKVITFGKKKKVLIKDEKRKKNKDEEKKEKGKREISVSYFLKEKFEELERSYINSVLEQKSQQKMVLK